MPAGSDCRTNATLSLRDCKRESVSPMSKKKQVTVAVNCGHVRPHPDLRAKLSACGGDDEAWPRKAPRPPRHLISFDPTRRRFPTPSLECVPSPPSRLRVGRLRRPACNGSTKRCLGHTQASIDTQQRGARGRAKTPTHPFRKKVAAAPAHPGKLGDGPMRRRGLQW